MELLGGATSREITPLCQGAFSHQNNLFLKTTSFSFHFQMWGCGLFSIFPLPWSVCLAIYCLYIPLLSTSTLLLPLPRASAEGESEKLIQFG